LSGKYKAKVHLDVLEKFASRPQGKYIDVTAITAAHNLIAAKYRAGEEWEYLPAPQFNRGVY